ncbi:hypothetical protein B0T10DRAFT_249221 [Thelonectria olida]|uniref:Uncharacterized protein n=1 Tax=Thelonectria olida TaxID=1576542 RepID=A0A9P9AQ08_9HYPO|nr:hypothetical protein B0T10DRAFT_249221 [Thelonectria olida]
MYVIRLGGAATRSRRRFSREGILCPNTVPSNFRCYLASLPARKGTRGSEKAFLSASSAPPSTFPPLPPTTIAARSFPLVLYGTSTHISPSTASHSVRRYCPDPLPPNAPDRTQLSLSHPTNAITSNIQHPANHSSTGSTSRWKLPQSVATRLIACPLSDRHNSPSSRDWASRDLSLLSPSAAFNTSLQLGRDILRIIFVAAFVSPRIAELPSASTAILRIVAVLIAPLPTRWRSGRTLS